MERKIAALVAAFALLAVPASSLGGDDGSKSPRLDRAGLGQVVAKDAAKHHPQAAVARTELTEFGKMSWRITSKPSGLPVDFAFMVRCEKASLFDYYPGPGDVKTVTKKAPFSGKYFIPLADPDTCDFQVFGSIPGESDKRGRVIAKIYRK